MNCKLKKEVVYLKMTFPAGEKGVVLGVSRIEKSDCKYIVRFSSGEAEVSRSDIEIENDDL